MSSRDPRRLSGLLAFLLASLVAPGGCAQEEPIRSLPSSEAKPPPAPTTPAPEQRYELTADQKPLLTAWYQAVGPRRDKESFGNLITRSGEYQVDRPYDRHPQDGEYEDLRIFLDSFQCVSFAESCIAVARCTWLGTPDEPCFVREVKRSRYRNGEVDGYGSRLHYFTDWLADNVRRKRLTALTQAAGGERVRMNFSYMTSHPDKYPSMRGEALVAQITAEEKRLSNQPLWMISRDQIRATEDYLEDGDLLAIVGDKEGILIKHAGFVVRRGEGPPRMLHASSARKRVLVSSSLANYLLRRPDRRGIVISRPVPPRLKNEARAGRQSPPP